MKVNWIAFPLHPDTPASGQSLEDLFANRPVNVKDLIQRLKLTAEALGLPFGNRTMTYNSRLAQELAKYAASNGLEDIFQQKVFRAYFAKGLNIGDPMILIDLAKAAGLSAAEADQVIRERSFRDAVDRDWAQSVRMGITAVPTFVIGRNAIVGAQPHSVIVKFLNNNGVSRKSDTVS
jgi:predicted DsbA family dithiol-disulfide isomerase